MIDLIDMMRQKESSTESSTENRSAIVHGL